MQISPVPNATWSNAAAAQQAGNESRTAGSNASPAGGASPSVGDVERSTETMDRDANGRYEGGLDQRRNPSENSDQNPQNGLGEGGSILDLPAIGQTSELDLLG